VFTLRNARSTASGRTALRATAKTPVRVGDPESAVSFSQIMTPPRREDQLAFAELTQRADDAGASAICRRPCATSRALVQAKPAGDVLRVRAVRPPLALRFSRTGGFAGVLLSSSLCSSRGTRCI
jgi:hypothetical protein